MARKWRPSAAFRGGPFWSDVGNLYPDRLGRYVTAPVWAQVTGAGPATPGTTVRAWCAIDITGTGRGCIGTSTKLWTTNNFTAFTDSSKALGYTATSWSFAQYGNYTIATNGVDPIQVRDASGVGLFADLGGTPPTTAKILVTQSGCVLAFNLNSGGNCFAASDVGNHANWTTGDAVGSTPISHRPGDIKAAVAFKDVVIVFKLSSIYRLRYVGAPYKWTVELIADGNGASSMDSVVSCGDVLVFAGSTGQWLFDGASFRRADEGFFDVTAPIFQPTSIVASLYLPNEDAVWFAQPQTTPGAYVYNKSSDRWGSLSLYRAGSASLLSSYRPVTGAPDAIANVFGNSNATRVYLVDLASNPCVLTSTGKWGDQSGSPGATIGIDRVGTLDARTQYTGIVPTFVPYVYSLGNEAALSDFVVTVRSYDTLWATAEAYSAVATASGRQFDVVFDAKYLKVSLSESAKPFAIDDLRVVEASKTQN